MESRSKEEGLESLSTFRDEVKRFQERQAESQAAKFIRTTLDSLGKIETSFENLANEAKQEIEKLNEEHKTKLAEERLIVQKELGDVLERILQDQPDVHLRDALGGLVTTIALATECKKPDALVFSATKATL